MVTCALVCTRRRLERILHVPYQWVMFYMNGKLRIHESCSREKWSIVYGKICDDDECSSSWWSSHRKGSSCHLPISHILYRLFRSPHFGSTLCQCDDDDCSSSSSHALVYAFRKDSSCPLQMSNVLYWNVLFHIQICDDDGCSSSSSQHHHMFLSMQVERILRVCAQNVE